MASLRDCYFHLCTDFVSGLSSCSHVSYGYLLEVPCSSRQWLMRTLFWQHWPYYNGSHDTIALLWSYPKNWSSSLRSCLPFTASNFSFVVSRSFLRPHCDFRNLHRVFYEPLITWFREFRSSASMLMAIILIRHVILWYQTTPVWYTGVPGLTVPPVRMSHMYANCP